MILNYLLFTGDIILFSRYANRAKNIKNKAKINEDPKDAMLREFQKELEKLKAQLAEGRVSLILISIYVIAHWSYFVLFYFLFMLCFILLWLVWYYLDNNNSFLLYMYDEYCFHMLSLDFTEGEGSDASSSEEEVEENGVMIKRKKERRKSNI